MVERYKHQPIIAEDWPPRIGKHFFGRLALIEKQDLITQSEHQKHWHLLRGRVDEISHLPGSRQLKVENILETESPDSPKPRIVVDGPPGIGKTTLCRKLLNMWSNGTLDCQQYHIVLYCPLRNSKIVNATELKDLFVYESPTKVSKVIDWMLDREGDGVLIIFDGWDELSSYHRQHSLAARIIRNDLLAYCSVIVTSRSYASSSLLAMHAITKHVQVIGFSQYEVASVIRQALEDPTSPNKESKLADKLIKDLNVRGDVQSLCYIPLVCSMVILVYRQNEGQLPTTLTQLYENFILLTIRRHVETRHDTNSQLLFSLESLPVEYSRPLKELSKLAYINLAETRMTFSSHDIHQVLAKAAKEDYFGLLTAFKEHDTGEEKHQFIHLSIQEFLAAWWIVKYENTEEVFKDHFDDDHFRMSLRFVAGLTHLENKIYEQYFNTKINIMFEKTCLKQPDHYRWLYSYYKHSMIRNRQAMIYIAEFNELRTLLFQLLYESQNVRLCQVFAQSMKDQSLCIHHMGIGDTKIKLTLFDWLCFGYFFNNTKWNYLYLGRVQQKELSVFTSALTNDSVLAQCTRLFIECWNVPDNSLALSFLEKSLLQKLEALFLAFSDNLRSSELSKADYCLLLPQVVKLPQLKMLYFHSGIATTSKCKETSKCIELEKCIAESKLQELIISIDGTVMAPEHCNTYISSIIKGLAQNKKIKSFTLKLTTNGHSEICEVPEGVIENLLKHNNTLQALSLKSQKILLHVPLNITEVNTPLTALKIKTDSSDLMTALFPHVKLHCLILTSPYPLHLISFSQLQCLSLTLNSPQNVTELFDILAETPLKTPNIRLSSLRLVVEEGSVFTICSIGRRKFSCKYKKCMSASLFISILTGGILNSNNSIQQLSIPIYLPVTNKQLRNLFIVLSQKNNITELEVVFKLDQSYYMPILSEERKFEPKLMKTIFYEQVLPVISDMLSSHRTIKFLKIVCEYLNESKETTTKQIEDLLNESGETNKKTRETNTKKIMDLFYKTPFHSLEKLEIWRSDQHKQITTYKRFNGVKMHLVDNE